MRISVLALLLLLESPDPVDRLTENTATYWAKGFVRKLEAPWSVRVEIEDTAIEALDARTVKDKNGTGCVLKVRRSQIRILSVIAHEACHCVLDFPLLTEHGYDRTVTANEVRRMEMRARNCTDVLMER